MIVLKNYNLLTFSFFEENETKIAISFGKKVRLNYTIGFGKLCFKVLAQLK